MKLRLCLYFFILPFLVSIKSTAQKTPLDFNLVSGTNEISIGKILGVTQDKRGYIWFCDQLNKCLIRYDGYRMKVYRNDPEDSNSIASSGFECFAADSSGNIWLATNEGVDKLNPLTGIATHYRFNKNSPCKGGFTASIIVDHSNSIWLGTSEGLYNLNQKTGSVNYTQPVIFLPGLKLNGISVTQAKSNLLNGPIEEVTEIRLQHNQNIFSIDFTALHYADPENNILQYMLEGYETEWRNVEQQQTARPGFIFEL